MNLERYENQLIEELGVNEEVVNALVAINGYNLETLEDLLYYYTGYRTFDQLEKMEVENYE